MPNITPLPPPPTRQDPVNFNDRADEFLKHLESPFVPELNALRTEVLGAQAATNQSATNAAASASAAAQSATAAATSAQQADAASEVAQFTANAAMWDAGESYAVGQAAISPSDLQAYRRKVAGTSATDPSDDPANWEFIGRDAYTKTEADALLAGKVDANNPTTSSVQGTAANSLTRRDFVTGLDGANVKLTGSQTIAGAKTFSNALSYSGTLTGGTGVVNLGSGQFYKDASGNVGIGTSSPSYKLQVSEASTSGGVDLINIATRGTQTSGNFADLSFRLGNLSSRAAVIRSLTQGGSAGNGHNLAFLTSPNVADPAERMRITSGGQVGIGTSSPDARLHVVGRTISTQGFYSVVVNVGGSAAGDTDVDLRSLGLISGTSVNNSKLIELTLFESSSPTNARLARFSIVVRADSSTITVQTIQDVNVSQAEPITISCPSSGVLRFTRSGFRTATAYISAMAGF